MIRRDPPPARLDAAPRPHPLGTLRRPAPGDPRSGRDVVRSSALLLGFIGWNGIQVFTRRAPPADRGPRDKMGAGRPRRPDLVRGHAVHPGHAGGYGRRGDPRGPTVGRAGPLHGRGRAALGPLDHPTRDGGLRRHPERRLRLARDHDPRAVPAGEPERTRLHARFLLVRRLARPRTHDPADHRQRRIRRIPRDLRPTCARHRRPSGRRVGRPSGTSSCRPRGRAC